MDREARDALGAREEADLERALVDADRGEARAEPVAAREAGGLRDAAEPVAEARDVVDGGGDAGEGLEVRRARLPLGHVAVGGAREAVVGDGDLVGL